VPSLVSGNLNPVELKRELDKLQRKISRAYDKKTPNIPNISPFEK